MAAKQAEIGIDAGPRRGRVGAKQIQPEKIMKNYLLAAFSLSFALNGAEVQFGDNIVLRNDRRIVVTAAGAAYDVDLAPLHAWFQDKSGVRPLKGWKQIKIFSLKGNRGGLDQCVVQHEDGKLGELFVKNLPQEIKDFILIYKDTEAYIANLKSAIDNNQMMVRRDNATALIGAGGSREFVEFEMNKRKKANLDAVNLIEQKESLVKWENYLRQMKADAPQRISVFAWQTPENYANLDIVDCGKVKK